MKMTAPDLSPQGDTRDDPLFVQAIGRAMLVMQAFSDADRPLTLSEIASRAGITRSAAQRVVHTLRRLGYLHAADAGRGFLPDLKILDLTYDYLRLNPLLRRASPVLLELRRNVRERVDLSLFDGQRMVYASRLQSKREAYFATLVGNTVPTFCTSGGWAVMAMLPDEQVDDLLAGADLRPLTPRTLTDPGAIRQQVRRAREAGHALALEQVLMGEIALAVAIPDASGRPVAAIHVAGSLSEWEPEEFRRRVAPLASEAANAIKRA